MFLTKQAWASFHVDLHKSRLLEAEDEKNLNFHLDCGNSSIEDQWVVMILVPSADSRQWRCLLTLSRAKGCWKLFGWVSRVPCRLHQQV